MHFDRKDQKEADFGREFVKGPQPGESGRHAAEFRAGAAGKSRQTAAAAIGRTGIQRGRRIGTNGE